MSKIGSDSDLIDAQWRHNGVISTSATEVHMPGTCDVCDGLRQDPEWSVEFVKQEPNEHSAPLDTAPVLADMGPLGVEIEEYPAAEARKFYNLKTPDLVVNMAGTQVPIYSDPSLKPGEIGFIPPNPKQRFGDLKPALQLVPPALIIHTAKALKEGADKYGAYNWRTQPVEVMTYIGGLLRHTAAYLDGEDIDPESSTGKSHLEGMAANIAIILDALDLGTLIDNRPPKGPAPGLLRMPKRDTTNDL